MYIFYFYIYYQKIDNYIKNYYKECYDKVKKEYPNDFSKINSYNEYVDLYYKYQELKKNQKTPSQKESLIDKPVVTNRNSKEKHKLSKNKAPNSTTININDKKNSSNYVSLCCNKVKSSIIWLCGILFSVFSLCFNKTKTFNLWLWNNICSCTYTNKKESHSTSDFEDEVKTPFIENKNFTKNQAVAVKHNNIRYGGKIINVNSEYSLYL